MDPRQDIDIIADQLGQAYAREDWTAVESLSAVLTDLETRERARRAAVTLHAAALWYAQQGLHVFPLAPGSKIPRRGSHGFQDATTDAARVDAWWTADPQANIGIATGHLVDVIDIDGTKGVMSWVRAMWDETDTYLGPPTIGKVSTPRPGGTHLYVAADPGKGNRAGILPGVDYRGTGGYVVAPPSHTEQGPYVWIHGHNPDLSAAQEAA